MSNTPATQTVEVKVVSTFTGNDRFFIPSYQRGYRWGEVQVRQLVDDLLQAAAAKKPYCLQPLVVRWDKDNTRWRVIDGQQRLTTLWLLLDSLDKRPAWHLQYERHHNAETPLDIPTTKPDGTFVNQAMKTLKAAKGIEPLKTYLDSSDGPFFLWYEPEGEEREVFARLNSGKISLSNAELIKARLLANKADIEQTSIANRWDAIEQRLQDDDFWYFVNPEPRATRFQAARIDFLFELWMRQQKTVDKGFEENPEQEFRRDPFVVYNAVVGKEKKSILVEKAWKDICECFDKMEEWYGDQRFYHLIGFLMTNRTKETKKRFETLKELLAMVTGEAKKTCLKSAFEKEVGSRCATALFGTDKIEDCLGKWFYGKENEAIQATLLLFNLALTNHEGLERTRFPFGAFRKTQWSLEHIHPQKKGGTNVFGNLALLPRDVNSEFSDGSFHEKREELRKWFGVDEAKDQKVTTLRGFIPQGTRLVFARFVGLVQGQAKTSEDKTDEWDESGADGALYQAFVVKTIKKYLKIEK